MANVLKRARPLTRSQQIERAFIAKDWALLKRLALEAAAELERLEKVSFAREVVASTIGKVLTQGLSAVANAVNSPQKKDEKKES